MYVDGKRYVVARLPRRGLGEERAGRRHGDADAGPERRAVRIVELSADEARPLLRAVPDAGADRRELHEALRAGHRRHPGRVRGARRALRGVPVRPGLTAHPGPLTPLQVRGLLDLAVLLARRLAERLNRQSVPVISSDAGSAPFSSFSILVIASFCVFSSAPTKSLHLVSPPGTDGEHPTSTRPAITPETNTPADRFMVLLNRGARYAPLRALCTPGCIPVKPAAALKSSE